VSNGTTNRGTCRALPPLADRNNENSDNRCALAIIHQLVTFGRVDLVFGLGAAHFPRTDSLSLV